MFSQWFRRILTWRFLFLIGISVVGLSLFGVSLQGTATAEQPQAITLLYFQATGMDGAVLIEWATATEFETAGFWLKRATAALGPYTVLNDIGFIPAAGGGIGGAEYSATDHNVTNGITYWYKLVEVELNGTENETEPIWVVAGPQTSTPTATATSPPGTTPSPTATRTPTATVTQPSTGPGGTSATATPTATATSGGGQSQPPASSSVTPQPSATPRPTTQGQSGGGATGTGGTPQSLAQAPSPTGPAGYPVPPSETLIPPPDAANSPNGYPLRPTTALMPYPGNGSLPPAGSNDPLDGSNGMSESQNHPSVDLTSQPQRLQTQTPADQQPAVQEASSRVLLWVAFLAALLVFGAGAVGSIIIFTRQGGRDDSQ
jgi:hypothetical protein